MRNLRIAWYTLAYINDVSLINQPQRTKITVRNYKLSTYILKTILATLIEAQLAGALDDFALQFDNKTKRVNLKVLVIFIIGDVQGKGKICYTTCCYSIKLN
jgi:hypothetical protein